MPSFCICWLWQFSLCLSRKAPGDSPSTDDKTQECICTLLSTHSQRKFWWKSFSCRIFRCLSSEMKLLLMFRALSSSTVSRESGRHQQKPACPWFKRSFNEFRKLNNRAIEEILTFKGWTDGTVNKRCIHVIYLKLLVNVMKRLRTSKWGRVCWVFVISNIIVGWVIFRSSGKLFNPSNFWSSAHVLLTEQWPCLCYCLICRILISLSQCWSGVRGCVWPGPHMWLRVMRLAPAPWHDWQSLATGAGAGAGASQLRTEAGLSVRPALLLHPTALPSKGCHRAILNLAHPDFCNNLWHNIWAEPQKMTRQNFIHHKHPFTDLIADYCQCITIRFKRQFMDNP